MTKRKKETLGSLFSFPVDISGRGLRCWHNLNVVQANMGGPGDCENNGVGNVFSSERGNSFVHVVGSLGVPFVADDGEFCFNHSLGNVRDFDVVF